MKAIIRYSIVVSMASLLLPGLALAQAPTDATAAPTETQEGMRTVQTIVGRLTEGAGSGIKVVADSTVADIKAPVPADTTTPDNVEAQIAALVAALPKGATWAKFYLPAADAHAYKGDDLSDYALAQSKLFGKVGAPAAGTVEVMGKEVAADKAQAVIDALNLKPIYLITNPSVKANGWSAMTPEQRQAYAAKQAQRILNMDPQAAGAEFANTMGQQFAVMQQVMSQATPEQRQALQQTMMGAFSGMGGSMGRTPGMRRGGPPNNPYGAPGGGQ